MYCSASATDWIRSSWRMDTGALDGLDKAEAVTAGSWQAENPPILGQSGRRTRALATGTRCSVRWRRNLLIDLVDPACSGTAASDPAGVPSRSGTGLREHPGLAACRPLAVDALAQGLAVAPAARQHACVLHVDTGIAAVQRLDRGHLVQGDQVAAADAHEAARIQPLLDATQGAAQRAVMAAH